MRDLSEILTVERVCDLKSTRKDEVLVELCGLASSAPEVTDPHAFLQAIRARETVMSTGIGMGIAIPHAKIPSVTDFVMAAGRSRRGIDFDSLDGLPVHIVILIGSSDTQASDFLKLMARIGGLFNRSGVKERFLDAKTPEDMYRLLAEAD
jgi:mannitol/fructose-specific phosphotransferase system IIA component (Ntr-type)